MIKDELMPVPDFPNYFVSSNGCVFSTKRGVMKELKKEISKAGYERVRFYNKGVNKLYLVHRLVLSVFTGGMKDLFVNHIDGNKSNNNLENLEWCTHSENVKHAFATGLNNSSKARKRVSLENIFRIMGMHNNGESSEKISMSLNIPRQTIMNITSGRRNSAITGLKCSDIQPKKTYDLKIVPFYDDSEELTGYGTKGHHDFELVKQAVKKYDSNSIVDLLIKDGGIDHLWHKRIPTSNMTVEVKEGTRGSIPYTVWSI